MKAGIDPNELKVVIFQSGRIGGTNLQLLGMLKR